MADVKKYVEVLNKLIRRYASLARRPRSFLTLRAGTSTCRGRLRLRLFPVFFSMSTAGPMLSARSSPSRPL